MNCTTALLFVASTALNACAAIEPAARQEGDEWMRYKPAEREEGREWIAVAVSSDDRRGSDSAEVSDAAAFTLEGGYDILVTKPLRAGFEIGVVWSQHDVPVVSGTATDPRLYVTRWNLGGRLALNVKPLNAVIYADGGIYVRDESSADEPSFGQHGRGNYVGGGLDFWFDASGRMGPFVRMYDFADSDLTDVLVGLSATFSF